MAEEGYVLSKGDVEKLKRVLQIVGNSDTSDLRLGYLSDSHQAPEVYVAKLPEDGIPARVGLKPGYAECDIYKQQVASFGSDQTELVLLSYPNGDPYKKFVRNLELTVLTGTYITVKRDKYGFWMPSVGGGGSHAVIRFRVISLAPYTDEISSPCEAVIAEVLSVSCQSSSVSVGDEVTIYDPSNCWFNVPIEVLEGASGQAVLMEAGVYEQVPDCVEASEEGCWWLAQHLCCTEELYAN